MTDIDTYNNMLDEIEKNPGRDIIEHIREIVHPKTPEPNPNAPLTTKELLALNTIFKSQPLKSSPAFPLHSFAARTLHMAAQGLSEMALLPPFQISSATTTVPPATTASALFSQPKGKAKKTSTTASGSGAIFSSSGGGGGSGGGGEEAPGSPGGGSSRGGGGGKGAASLSQGQGFAQIPAARGELIGIPPKPFDGNRS
jgi:hypothetical protein